MGVANSSENDKVNGAPEGKYVVWKKNAVAKQELVVTGKRCYVAVFFFICVLDTNSNLIVSSAWNL